MPSAASLGGVCVIGTTVTIVSPASLRVVRTTAQGRSLVPSA